VILYMLATRFASGALSGESYGPCRVQLLAVALGLILDARLGVPRFAVLELEGAERLPERGHLLVDLDVRFADADAHHPGEVADESLHGFLEFRARIFLDR